MHKKTIEIYGRKVGLMIVGKPTPGTKPIFMLHGWGGSKESWESLIKEIKKNGDMDGRFFFAIDFPGFGDSQEPVTPWTISDYSKFLEQVIKVLYKEFELSGDYDVIVHSFGGRVLLKLLSPQFEHQIVEKPDKLVLVAAAGIKPKRTLRMKVAGMAAKGGKLVLSLPGLRWLAPMSQKILYKLLKSHDYEKSSGIMRETFLNAIDEDLVGVIDHIKNSTLIIWGRKDSYVPFSAGVYMHQRILGSKLVAIPDGRHGIHKTHAALCSGWINEFLQQ